MPTDLAHSAYSATPVHGVLLSVYGLGVLLTGASGSGKSTLAWQLLQRGHALVSDDAPLLARTGTVLQGCADPILQGLLHVRGAGVLDIARLLGRQAVQMRQRVDIVLHLATSAEYDEPTRLAPLRRCRAIQSLALPELSIVAAAPNHADLAEALLRAELAGRNSDDGQHLLQQRLKMALQAAPMQAAPMQAAPMQAAPMQAAPMQFLPEPRACV